MKKSSSAEAKLRKAGGGVCAPKGFLAGAVRAGIKRVASEKTDLAMVFSKTPCVAAGVFTRNRVQAAPVLVSKQHLRSKRHHAVLLNSGNANACTGAQGLADAKSSAELAARALGVRPSEVLICSTGRIGVPLPIKKIAAGLEQLPGALSRKGGGQAAIAIMTSDTHPKEAAREVQGAFGKFRVGAMAKGAGMIDPNMATMLCVVCTDAAVPANSAKRLLRAAVDDSFNRITVDGDMSTNDTVLLLANGESEISISDEPSERAFADALRDVCRDLAMQIVRDGEGISRVVALTVRGARSPADARRAADAVGNSILLKCAWAGGDPNWGRILDALGYSGAVFDPDAVDVFYGQEPLVLKGQVGPASPEKVKTIAARKEFSITVDLHAGAASHQIFSTDLTEEYVRLNLSE